VQIAIMKETIKKIKSLLNRSNGSPILLPNNESLYFIVHKRYEQSEIEAFETSFGIYLPNDYKEFMTEVGACDLYMDEYRLGIQIKRLEELEKYSKQVFIDLDNPFPQLLLITSVTRIGDDGGFDLKRKEPNFSVFFNEIPAELWTEETDDWTTFSNWLTQLVDSNGDKGLP
jgi:hypothetical protein